MNRGAPGPLTRDTIVAIATPPGSGAIGVVRLSGSAARAVATPLLSLSGERTLEMATPRVLHAARLIDPASGVEIDRVLVALMPAPRSYTGEDVVEISCHGSPAVLAAVVDRLVGKGARLATPGEFTRRAYLNGRLDLVQAEAVALLIGARSERAASLAARQVSGVLSTAIHRAREGLLDVVAGLEVSLDFPDDALGLSLSAAADRCGALTEEIDRISTRARHGRLVYGGLRVMLAGAPNVGKSSLLNALLGRDRAIVSPQPGTTRDLVDGELITNGVVMRLFDGAGIGLPRDPVDADGMSRARDAVRDSDLVLVVLDRSRPLAQDDHEVLRLTADRERLLIANKIDLEPAGVLAEVDCECSALSGAGIAEVRSRLDAWAKSQTEADGDEAGVVASLRVSEEIERARRSLGAVVAGLAKRVPLEVVLVDLRQGLSALDQALGIEADDAVLDRIFATFCVGK